MVSTVQGGIWLVVWSVCLLDNDLTRIVAKGMFNMASVVVSAMVSIGGVVCGVVNAIIYGVLSV